MEITLTFVNRMLYHQLMANTHAIDQSKAGAEGGGRKFTITQISKGTKDSLVMPSYTNWMYTPILKNCPLLIYY